ncbi:hypothetical protein IJG91_00295 [Candidatus Saccharibacteria bacterium]|nr:hypothetical protein [Candidatus Saccharibacteria bacterium]
MKILFLGAGAFGEAMSRITKYNGHENLFFDPIKFPETKLEDVSNQADIIIYTAPSEKHSEILPNLPKDAPLICASKGFLSLKPFCEFKNFSAFGGAAFADHIKEDADITFTASSELSEQLFSTETIKVEYTKDTLGILLCGALKNIYAIGAGMYGEVQKAEETQDYLVPYFTSVIKEMQVILKENHANAETLALSCGISDLVLSSTTDSRNFRFGRSILENTTPETGTIEGVAAISSIKNYPDFIIPTSATILKSIIEKVQDATK